MVALLQAPTTFVGAGRVTGVERAGFYFFEKVQSILAELFFWPVVTMLL